jgi:hypothetical protein
LLKILALRWLDSSCRWTKNRWSGRWRKIQTRYT